MNCAERWLEHQGQRAEAGQLSAEGVKQLRYRIRKHWPKQWDGVCTHEIRKGHLQDWAMQLQLEGFAPPSIKVMLGNLRTMLEWLRDRQELFGIPPVPSVNVPERSPQLLTREQQDVVLEEIVVGRRGWLLDLIQRFLGHRDVRNTERYSRHHDEALVALVRGSAWYTEIRRLAAGLLLGPKRPCKRPESRGVFGVRVIRQCACARSSAL